VLFRGGANPFFLQINLIRQRWRGGRAIALENASFPAGRTIDPPPAAVFLLALNG
jgi:hypothetical protein